MYFFSNLQFMDETIRRIVRLDVNGEIWWLGEGEEDAGYLAWVAEGNTATEWTGN